MSNNAPAASETGGSASKHALDALAEELNGLEVGDVGEPKRIKPSARDLLANLSDRRISITEIEFIGTSPQHKGGYADVHVATLVRKDCSQQKPTKVAVKKLRFVLNSDMPEEKFLRLFVNEARLLNNLSHRNIVQIIGFVEDVEKRIAWLVFPWEENGNLREFLRSGTWEIPERISLIRDVAFGLEYLHTRQPPICHGDLKSLNILVSSSNRSIITDFGSARIIREAEESEADSGSRPAASASPVPPENAEACQFNIVSSNTALTLTGPACSFRWASPEVMRGKPPGLANDIWALGWIAWEAITDYYPFEEINAEWDVTMRVIEGQLPLIYNHDQLSQTHMLCSIIQSCWRHEPEKRPPATECRKTLGFLPWAIPVPKSGERHKIRSTALLLQIGNMHRFQGRYVASSKMYEQGLAIARSTGDEHTLARLLVSLAANYRVQSQYREAEVALTEALVIYKRIVVDEGRAMALEELGTVQQLRSKLVEAEASLTEALAIHTRIGNDLGRANSLYRLGFVQFDRTRYAEGEGLYTEALAIYKNVGSDLGQANALRGLGNIQQSRSKYVDAEASYTEALAINKNIGDDLGRAHTVKELGHVQRLRSKYAEAEASYTNAQAIYNSIGNDLNRADALAWLGDVQQALSKHFEAETSYIQALDLCKNFGDSIQRVNASLKLAEIRLDQRRYHEAKPLIDDAGEISRRIDYGWGKKTSKTLMEVVEAGRSST